MNRRRQIWKTARALALLACALGLPSTARSQLREITWVDLSPAPSASDDPLGALNQDQLDVVLWVLNVLETEPTRSPENEALYEEVDGAMPTIREAGIDLDAVMEWRKRARTAVVEELNGQRVRMPGYLLPLEVEGNRVTEFFLVPYVGACVHVPPPPPNQLVHVKLAGNEGYESRELFEPVWVTGILSTTSAAVELYLVDGSADIDTSYSMTASRVEPYR